MGPCGRLEMMTFAVCYMSRVTRKLVFGVTDQVRHKRAVQPQNLVKGLFGNKEVEGLYFLRSAGQLRGYRTADACLCFRMCKKQDSHDAAHMFSATLPRRHRPIHIKHLCTQLLSEIFLDSDFCHNYLHTPVTLNWLPYA